MDEQEIYATFVPQVADIICEYETATVLRQVEIISELTKYFIIHQLDGKFGALRKAHDELIERGWMNKDGRILIDTKTIRSW